ncbi:polysaccharide deacetylase family protein [Helicobacter sp. MIT 99-5507]|uniref:polysaccharide deacetylase family protein n=1 Tax=Helicobacter sp. MIT 99-5507 TaxID=152489 RepID=UPI002163EF10|nr:polysaccharide deacetylase family protein [Helicobacter sp. MIT 99-5507]
MKQKIKAVLNSRGGVIGNLRRKIFEGKGVIFMLHQIAPINPNKLPANENMKISPDFLESFIINLKNDGYSFISIDELINHLNNNTLQKKNICITIDDGYKDNLTYGFDIFKKHKIPFCIYTCASFLEKKANMWWFGLEDYLLQHSSIIFNDEKIKLDTIEEKNITFLKIRDYLISKINDYEHAKNTMQEIGINYDMDKYNDLALNYDDINFMLNDKDNLMTLGHHTYSHPIFNNINDEEIKQDILKANNVFNNHFGFIPKHFAYPFGGRIEVSKKHFELIKNIGFKSATTTRHGSIFDEHKTHLYSLPRIFLKDILI